MRLPALCAPVCLALIAPFARAQCPISFAPSVPTNGGNFQWQVVSGDFNEDGRPDIAFARSLTNQVAVQLAASTPGTFLAPVAYNVGASPVSLGVGDCNGDGHPDLLTANLGASDVSWLRGMGAAGGGGFQPAVSVPVGTHPALVIVRDLNADGRADFVTANDLSANVTVRIADAAGGFAAAAHYTVGDHPYGLAAADFTGDGLIDLAVGLLDSGTFKVLRNTGGGAMTLAAGTYTAGSSHMFAATGDVNLDAKPDLLVSDQDGGVYVLLGNGAPTSTFQHAVRYAAVSAPVFMAVGDFNRDQRPDVMVAGFGLHMAAVLQGNGTGTSTFQAPVLYPAGGNNPNGIAISDFNLDGRLDAAISVQAGAAHTSRILFSNDLCPLRCNADFNCDGDSSTDADIEAFFACIAGACPAAPCRSSSDFNGDGDDATDQDIEAFFRVLAGGTC